MAIIKKIRLPKGYKLILTSDVFSTGRYYEKLETSTTSSILIAADSTVTIDEYYLDRDFVIISDTGEIDYEIRLDLDDQDTSEVPYDNTASGLAAQNVQEAIDELAASAGTDDQIASEVPVTPAGNLASTDVQSALEELQTEIDGLGAPTADLDISIFQLGHGLLVGQPIKLVGSTYTLAQADNGDNAEVVGVVTSITDVDNFKHRPMFGRITGLSGLVSGTVYWLDPTTPGTLTSTEPTTTGQVKKVILVADSATSGYLKDHPGIIND